MCSLRWKKQTYGNRLDNTAQVPYAVNVKLPYFMNTYHSFVWSKGLGNLCGGFILLNVLKIPKSIQNVYTLRSA